MEAYIDPDDYWQAVVAQRRAAPDAFGVIEIGPLRGNMALIPEEIEEYAKNAYILFNTERPSEPAWESYPNKHLWRDTVTTWERNPRALPANGMEESVAQVFAVAEQLRQLQAQMVAVVPVPELPPVVEATTETPSTEKKGKK